MAEFRSMQDRSGEHAGVTDQLGEAGQRISDTALDYGQRISDTALDYGKQAIERTEEVATKARDAALDHPVATLAIVAGLAFAVGALWKIGSSRRQSRYDRLLARLGDLQSHVQSQMPRAWR